MRCRWYVSLIVKLCCGNGFFGPVVFPSNGEKMVVLILQLEKNAHNYLSTLPSLRSPFGTFLDKKPTLK